jgi:hypothetical protein
MPRYEGLVVTPWPAEQAFSYLANFDSVAQWDPGVSVARPLDANPDDDGNDIPAEGARFEVVARFLGRDVPLVYRTIQIDAPRKVVLRADGGRVVSTDTITVEPLRGGGAAVAYDARLELKGPMRLAELPMRLAFRRIGERARAGLERALS